MGKRKVLIVDDEEDFLRMTKLNLEKTDKYKVLTLANSKDILIHVYSFRPEVILLDVLMPKVGGIEVCEILNRDLIGRNIPVVILSALSKDADKLDAYKKGVVGYLAKPAELDIIIAAIEKALKFKSTFH